MVPQSQMGKEGKETMDQAPRKKVRVAVTRRKGKYANEPPVPSQIYPVIDTDLGRDNVENDLAAADREDLQ